MTLGKAFGFFLREASINLWRSWRVSLLAVLTIGVSLFVGGAFLLASGNLEELVARWRREWKVVVYLQPGVGPEILTSLEAKLRATPWVRGARRVDETEARERFRKTFPSLADLVDEGGEQMLPASLEVAVAAGAGHAGEYDRWVEGLGEMPGVALVDDDRDWLAQLATAVSVARALGLGLGLVLLAGAVFTIASVVRLTAYLYHDEIAIMRLVGATEFFIRGPFYAEGLLQGLLGGCLAGGGLFATWQLLQPRVASSAWGELLLSRFLSPAEIAGLVALGAGAGLAGAIASLRREKLGAVE